MRKTVITAVALGAVLVLGGCASTSASSSASSDASASASSEAAASVSSEAAASISSEAAASASSEAASSASSASSAASEASASASSASASSEASSQSQQAAPSGNPLTEDQVESIIQNNGYGNVLSMAQTQLDDGIWYWKVETSLSDGSVHTYMIDPDGNVTNEDAASESGTANMSENDVSNKLSQSDVEKIVWQQGFGEIQSMKQVELEDDEWYWQVVVRGSNNKTKTIMIDPYGNVSEQ